MPKAHQLSRLAAGATIAALVACSPRTPGQTATRLVRLPVSGASLVKLDVGAGFLRVEGSNSTSEVVVTGVAHAASSKMLKAIQLNATRLGDTIFVSCSIPGRHLLGLRSSASLDITVALPSTMALQVADSAGDAFFRRVGALRITHGAGRLDVDNVNGDLDVTDADGDMVLANVNGNVHIIDGAGSIHLETIHGSVAIPRDGAGEIQAVNVSGDLNVGAKESGEVMARGIGGNLAVVANGSGSIEYHDVKGHVAVPPG